MTFSFDAIGTHWQIDVYPAQIDVFSGKNGLFKGDGLYNEQGRTNQGLRGVNEQRTPEAHAVLFDKIKSRIAVFDKHYSRFRDDSLVAEMARNAGTYELPEDARPMMGLYETLYAATKGSFTPLIGSVMEDAGYDANYSLVPRGLRKPKAWNEIMEYQYPRLALKEPALLDFGALGKGYLIDIIGDLIEADGFASYVIDAGGDIRHRDHSNKSLRVGLEHPQDQSRVIGVIEITNKSICCSAGNRRTWAHFHHIINPHTLSSPRDVVSTWVVADSAMLADGIATSLFFVSPGRLASLFQFEYCILYPDSSIRASAGFEAEMYIKASEPQT